AVVTQRFAHEGELELVLARHRDAGRVDLGVARVGEGGAALVGPVGGGDVAAGRVGREEEDVGVAAGGKNHRVAGEALHLAGDEVARDDPGGPAVDDHEVEHLR